jgi:hypothetical protein
MKAKANGKNANLFAAGLLVTDIAMAIDWLWNKLSLLISAVLGKVLLTVIYIIILLPLAFLAKFFAGSGIELKPGRSSYYKSRNHTYTAEDLDNPW